MRRFTFKAIQLVANETLLNPLETSNMDEVSDALNKTSVHFTAQLVTLKVIERVAD